MEQTTIKKEINLAQYTNLNTLYRMNIEGFAMRIIKGASNCKIWIDKQSENYAGENSINARLGNAWNTPFSEFWIELTALSTDFIVVEISTDPGTRFVSELENALNSNAYECLDYDLGLLRAALALGKKGVAISILILTGDISLQLNTTADNLIPLAAITYPNFININQEFTEIYLTNAVQAGKLLRIYISKRD
jgi:hypothetical protein